MKEQLTLFEKDSLLRMLFSFFYCVKENPRWQERSRYAKRNREITKQMLPVSCDADYYFFLGRHFYALFLEGEGNVLSCRLEEYDTFYDIAKHHQELSFTYHLKEGQIFDLGKIKMVRKGNEK